MPYNPPTPSNWIYTHYCSDSYAKAYTEGWRAAQLGQTNLNPYPPSNHERDTTFSDELNYWREQGYDDGLGINN